MTWYPMANASRAADPVATFLQLSLLRSYRRTKALDCFAPAPVMFERAIKFSTNFVLLLVKWKTPFVWGRTYFVPLHFETRHNIPPTRIKPNRVIRWSFVE